MSHVLHETTMRSDFAAPPQHPRQCQDSVLDCPHRQTSSLDQSLLLSCMPLTRFISALCFFCLNACLIHALFDCRDSLFVSLHAALCCFLRCFLLFSSRSLHPPHSLLAHLSTFASPNHAALCRDTKKRDLLAAAPKLAVCRCSS